MKKQSRFTSNSAKNTEQIMADITLRQRLKAIQEADCYSTDNVYIQEALNIITALTGEDVSEDFETNLRIPTLSQQDGVLGFQYSDERFLPLTEESRDFLNNTTKERQDKTSYPVIMFSIEVEGQEPTAIQLSSSFRSKALSSAIKKAISSCDVSNEKAVLARKEATKSAFLAPIGVKVDNGDKAVTDIVASATFSFIELNDVTFTVQNTKLEEIPISVGDTLTVKDSLLFFGTIQLSSDGTGGDPINSAIYTKGSYYLVESPRSFPGKTPGEIKHTYISNGQEFWMHRTFETFVVSCNLDSALFLCESAQKKEKGIAYSFKFVPNKGGNYESLKALAVPPEVLEKV
jgi:hypothetical protein